MKPDKRVEEMKGDIYEAMRHLPHIGETATVDKIYNIFEQTLTQHHQNIISEVVEKGWDYIIEATRKESWRKEEFIKSLKT